MLCEMKQVASHLCHICSKCLHAASCRLRALRNCRCKQKYNKEAQVSWYKVCVWGEGIKSKRMCCFCWNGTAFVACTGNAYACVALWDPQSLETCGSLP